MAPRNLNRSVLSSPDRFDEKSVRRFWVELAILLKRENRPFKFFTNGQSEDSVFAESVVTEVPRR